MRSIQNRLYALAESIPAEDSERERFLGRLDEVNGLITDVSNHIKPPIPSDAPHCYMTTVNGNGVLRALEEHFRDLEEVVMRGYGKGGRAPINSVDILRKRCMGYAEDVERHLGLI